MIMEQLVFYENMEAYIDLIGLDESVCLIISDDLFAYEEKWTEEYKTKILDFINSFSTWGSIAIQSVLDYGKKIYDVDALEKDLRLLNIFVLFEQCDRPLFGLQYRTAYDIEHGCGLKIRGENFEITEVGGAEVSFC